jgi:hypothetical protein
MKYLVLLLLGAPCLAYAQIDWEKDCHSNESVLQCNNRLMEEELPCLEQEIAANEACMQNAQTYQQCMNRTKEQYQLCLIRINKKGDEG